ncbi:MAG: hypothetical protein KTR31_31980 [Myxococcales bacterium]|nr:hypothetical protein [Myxococcales bacterium]
MWLVGTWLCAGAWGQVYSPSRGPTGLHLMPTVGVHLALSRDGVGLGLDAEILGGVYRKMGRGGFAWSGAVGPYVAVDVLTRRGPSLSVGGRVSGGAVVVDDVGWNGLGGDTIPVGTLALGFGHRFTPWGGSFRFDARARFLVFFDLGTYVAPTPDQRGRLDVAVLPGVSRTLTPDAFPIFCPKE